MPTKIEWAEEVWNPITGCTPVSEGCAHCYAKRMAHRLAGRCGYPADDPFRVTFHRDRLNEPLRWKKPRRIFVCSMSDLFHEKVPSLAIDMVWEVMKKCPHHTFMILTKRPERFLSDYGPGDGFLKNVWVGVTAENQEQADKRIPILLSISAAVRFVSVEPMLSALQIRRFLDGYGGLESCGEKKPRLDLVICGAETGHGKRRMSLDDARSLRDQCAETGTPFFFKKDSNGSHLLDGQAHEGMPQYIGIDYATPGAEKTVYWKDGQAYERLPER